MIIQMKATILGIAKALDAVEGELFGASTHHGERVAALSAVMGARLGFSDSELIGLTACALLHDNALTEYILSEKNEQTDARNLRLHCEYGQRNVDSLPLGTNVDGYIRYHHERADGKGPFRLTEHEIPLGAQIIGIADHLDVSYHLQRIPLEDLEDFKKAAITRSRNLYTPLAVEALTDVLTPELLSLLRDDYIADTVDALLPVWGISVGSEGLMRLATLAARIIDYKSIFTRKHTVQIANRAWLMSWYYGFDKEKRVKLYLAAALHDIGKLLTPTDILEKPGKLEPDEFATAKRHVSHTRDLLGSIDGLGDVCEWASNHHEKLDGSGYPLGKTAEELDLPSRLMACIDIYQAVSEERPYHPRRSHRESMPILYDMAEHGKIDRKIVADVDAVMAPYSGLDIPNIDDSLESDMWRL